MSVLVCTYNRAEMLRDTLNSVQAQSWPHELIVVDDGSEDETWEFLASKPEIRSFRQPGNQGKTYALNRGIAEARGEFLLVLDDDDMIVPGALTLLAKANRFLRLPGGLRDEAVPMTRGTSLIIAPTLSSPASSTATLRSISNTTIHENRTFYNGEAQISCTDKNCG